MESTGEGRKRDNLREQQISNSKKRVREGGHRMQSTKQVIFRLGQEEYGLDIMIVNAIEKYTTKIKVPNAPSFVTGIINLRGDVIPVYSLRMKFGMEVVEPTDDTKFIITKSNGISMAYEVDRMEGIVDIEAENIKEAPSVIRSEKTSYIKEIANLNGKLVVLLDHNGILSYAEQNMIGELIKEKEENVEKDA